MCCSVLGLEIRWQAVILITINQVLQRGAAWFAVYVAVCVAVCVVVLRVVVCVAVCVAERRDWRYYDKLLF